MLTSTGKVVAGLAPLLLVVGYLTDYPEVLALGLTCLIALVAAGAWMLVRPSIRVTRTISPARVREGEGSRAVLDLTNEGSRRSLPVVAVETVGARNVTVPLPSLGPGATRSTT